MPILVFAISLSRHAAVAGSTLPRKIHKDNIYCRVAHFLKTAFRAHPAVKKAKRGKKGVRWEGLAVAAETRRAPG